MPEAHKFTNGQNLTVLTFHDVSRILNSKVQNDSGSIFKAAVTQGVSKALGTEYHLHCSWRPQSSGKVDGVGEDSWESLDCKEIQPVHPKGDQSWVFIGGTDVEAEAPILWSPDEKSWLIWKDPDAGKD